MCHLQTEEHLLKVLLARAEEQDESDSGEEEEEEQEQSEGPIDGNVEREDVAGRQQAGVEPSGLPASLVQQTAPFPPTSDRARKRLRAIAAAAVGELPSYTADVQRSGRSARSQRVGIPAPVLGSSEQPARSQRTAVGLQPAHAESQSRKRRAKAGDR